MVNSYTEIGKRFGFDPSLTEFDLQQRLEEMREHLKKEIRKEMKIKEGAEKLKEATTDKKSLSDVQSIVKKSNNKLKELQTDLQEINAYLLVSNSTSFHDSLAGNVWNLTSTIPSLFFIVKNYFFLIRTIWTRAWKFG